MRAKRSRKRTRTQRGSVSVELALVLPLLLLVVVGSVHFGRALMTRHKLTEATNYATRAAVVQGTTNRNVIRGLIQTRMGTGSGCSRIRVNVSTPRDALGVRRLEVRSRCTVDTGIGGSLLGAVGPDELTVIAAMPL